MAFIAGGHAFAQDVILHLKDGDQISGVVISESTNNLVVSNRWAGVLSVPLKEIGQREILLAGTPNHVADTNHLAGTNQVGSTNLTNATAIAKIAPLKPQPPAMTNLFKHWRGEAEVGLDLIYTTISQQNYHGRFKLSYEAPYRTKPLLYFRNALDYSVEYGRTQGTNGVSEKSTDRMGASDKTTFDIRKRWYAYNLAGIGYDKIKNIDLQYEEGPGVGYHLFTKTNFVMNVEGGANYQVQYRSQSADSRDFFYRAAQDLNWKIGERTTLSEKLELFPRWEFSEFRSRFETTISYTIWRYVSLNLTVRDSYDTKPAAGTEANEVQIRSALGMKF